MELDIHKISGQEYKFQLTGVDKAIPVSIKLPELSALPFSTWGDWGLMYAFQLKPGEPVQISYNNVRRDLRCQALQIESPLRAFEREICPYYILVEDGEYDFRIFLYLNQQFDLDKVVVKRLSDQVHLFETSRIVDPVCEAM